MRLLDVLDDQGSVNDLDVAIGLDVQVAVVGGGWSHLKVGY